MTLPRFHFIHGYQESYWNALKQHGFVNDASGIKITQICTIPENLRFNQIAQQNTKLNTEIIQKHRIFYVDRLLGGTFYYFYPSDSQLIEYYRTQLGHDFLGFQLHEWASNCRDDWERIKKCLKKVPPPWNAQQIRNGIQTVSKDPDNINLSVANPEFYANMEEPKDINSFLQQLRQLYEIRKHETKNSLLPADSYHMAPLFEIAWGCRALLPEIGAQIPLTRVQIALTRGMAQLHSVRWGGYYESWGGKPFAVNFALKGQPNEWFITQEKWDFSFAKFGEKGGSSRALQRRLLHYLLLCGAEFISEEWGTSNTFADWRNFPLTEFGEIKRDFIQFANQSQNWPQPFIPIAILLPKEFPIVDIQFLNREISRWPWIRSRQHYLNYPIPSQTERQQFFHIHEVFQWLYGRKKDFHAYGNETHVMTNSGHPDVCDLIYPYDLQSQNFAYIEKIAQKYPFIIDLTADFKLQKNFASFQDRLIAHQTEKKFYHSLQKVYTKLPITVSGSVHWMINAEPDHPLILCSIFNNNGVERTAQRGDEFLPQGIANGKINMNNPLGLLDVVKSWPSSNRVERRSDLEYGYSIAPGGFMVLKWNKK